MARSRVMIVDDCEITLDVMKCALEEAGFAIVARSQALGTTAAILSEKPECLLMDVSMPALSGREIVRLVKQQSDTKVLLFSAKDEEVLMMFAETCGADGYIRKGQEALLSDYIDQVRSIVKASKRRFAFGQNRRGSWKQRKRFS